VAGAALLPGYAAPLNATDPLVTVKVGVESHESISVTSAMHVVEPVRRLMSLLRQASCCIDTLTR
jgi:hypothetical protein